MPNIERRSVVERHSPHFTEWDAFSPLSVGNGEFCYTADLTGTQTFDSFYQAGIPLLTQAQWAWHTAPYSDEQPVFDRSQFKLEEHWNGERNVPYITSNDGQQAPYNWLRANCHKFHMGRLSLVMPDGSAPDRDDISSPDQRLDLWTGILSSRYQLRCADVHVTCFVHPHMDMLCLRLTSPLVGDGLSLELSFPYGSPDSGGADWTNQAGHTSALTPSGPHAAQILRMMDDSRYFVTIAGEDSLTVHQKAPHQFILSGDGECLCLCILFSQRPPRGDLPDYNESLAAAESYWASYWQKGGFVSIGGGGREGGELERRIVLSQYLTAINCAGSLPPQETGLTMNSWYGKFHLEMHLWHAAHFALWNRAELLEKSLWYYTAILPRAVELAAAQGYKGARWPKMTDESGLDSPSPIGPLLIWQQPHPIYYAVLMYRLHPDRQTLLLYRDIVLATARFMADYPRWDDARQCRCLGPGMKDAPEMGPADQVVNPSFELEYWAWGLNQASLWMERLGETPDPHWREVARDLAPLPVQDGRYLTFERWATYTPPCNEGHPSVVGALGLLPGERVDRDTMRRTLHAVLDQWRMDSTWGWDFPMLAMCAARLGEPDTAVRCLMLDSPKNTYLPNGHNMQSSQSLPLYLPGNGALLLAVAMMCAGWDGCGEETPGFPDGWQVRWEDILPMP